MTYTKQLLSVLFAIIIIPAFSQYKSSEEYMQAAKFLRSSANKLVYRSNVRPVWLDDGTFWYRVSTRNGDEYVLIDPAKKSRKTAASRAELLGEPADGPINDSNIGRNEIPSPDGKKVVFIRDWNLWMRNLENGTETQLTTDGMEDFGYATDNAGWRKSDRPVVLWSPDSRKIATYQQDQRHVSDMYLVSTNVGSPQLQAWKYPLPEDEDIIRIHRVIIEVDEPRIIRLNITPDPRRGTQCDDISCSGAFDDNQWSKDGTKLLFVSSSRDHKEARVRMADAATGEVRDIFTEKVDTQYESGQGTINWHWIEDADELIWYSERDNWGHLYMYDVNTGALKYQITQGDYVITRVVKWDDKNKMAYFYAQGREDGRDPYFAHFYSVDYAGKRVRLLTPENGNHNVSISKDANYLVDNYSQPNVPPVSVLRDIKGKELMELEKADISDLEASGWQPPTPIKVKSRDGKWDLYGLMFTPTNLDESKKYPVVNYIYPGPQGGGVGSRSFYASRRDHQALAELGFVVIVIDGTCNPGRSKEFHDVCYGNMGDNTLEDQISGINQIATEHPFIDVDRVGIWGHSGGGFATAAAMFRYPEFYKVGISESGNHDNRNYEDDWGERYIGLLEGDNYENQANQNFAANLQGKLLLAHGGMDDNVPPYNTYLVVDALIKANKDFDMIVFPNARHGFGRDSDYMMRRRWDYFVEHLQGVQPPKEVKIQGR